MPAEEEAYGTLYRLQEWGEQAFKFWNHPREAISWYQAIAFCRWLGDKLGYEVDLPHEDEWEVAARYPDSRSFPWGNDFNAANANISVEGKIGQTSAVGIYPQGKNEVLGLEEMNGNVWEWCRNKYDNPQDDQVDASAVRRAIRGGSWYGPQLGTRSRSSLRPSDRSSYCGFRVVRRFPA